MRGSSIVYDEIEFIVGERVRLIDYPPGNPRAPFVGTIVLIWRTKMGTVKNHLGKAYRFIKVKTDNGPEVICHERDLEHVTPKGAPKILHQIDHDDLGG